MSEPTSIKNQIMTLIVSQLQELVTSGDFRKVERSMDLSVNAAVRPALQVYDGPERLVRKDNRGRTYHFDVGIKVLLEDPKDLASAKDLVVPKVQKIMESNLQLDGLANIVDGGEEVPFLAEAAKPLGGALVQWTIEYRRLLGDPYTTY